jgi:hypothetical protein
MIWISRDNRTARDQQAQGPDPTESTGHGAGFDGQSGGAYHLDPAPIPALSRMREQYSIMMVVVSWSRLTISLSFGIALDVYRNRD